MRAETASTSGREVYERDVLPTTSPWGAFGRQVVLCAVAAFGKCVLEGANATTASGRDAFEWTFGKCDARHWVDVFARFAEYLRNTARRVRVNRVGGVTEGDEDEGAETFRAVNWIADFMREVLENCGEGTAFTHGEAVTTFLEFRETCETVMRL